MLAAAADRTVHLTIAVADEQGQPISGAHINIYQHQIFGSVLLAAPPTHQRDTGADGLARFEIVLKTGEKLQFRIEIGREDLATQTRDIDRGLDFPDRLPLERFTLKQKSNAGEATIINAIVEVRSDKSQPVEGAKVLIRDPTLGAATGRFEGVTAADGRVTIPVWYTHPGDSWHKGKSYKFELKAAKDGYKPSETFVELYEQQVGKTVTAATIVLEKLPGAIVTVSVRDEETNKGVGDATVILDGAGYHSGTTNGDGTVSFVVPEIGKFQVRISQDYYQASSGELRVLSGEDKQSFAFVLKPKGKKDEGNDSITVTVLKRDPTDEKSKPSPLPGAVVKIGSIGSATDGSGQVTIKGAFEEKQKVSVEAAGYESQSTVVTLHKTLHYFNAEGSASFTLDPTSENMPLRLIVEVRGPDGPLKGAGVEFFLPPNRLIWGGYTDAKGERDFRGTDTPDVPVSQLRRGLTLNVTKDGYKSVLNRSVPADLLKPSNDARRFSVELELDEVTVPDLSRCTDLAQMISITKQAGLVPAPVAIKQKPAGAQKLFSYQSPAANSKARRGEQLRIFLNQKVAEKSVEPTPAPPTPSPSPTATASPETSSGDNLIVVPSVAGAESVDYMRTILNQAGFKSAFKAVKPAKKEDELKFVSQKPAAGERKPRGSLVVVFITQKFEAAESPTPTPVLAEKSGEMPNLIGLTLDQAVSRLTRKMRIGGDEVGDKPPRPEKAYTIYAQSPLAGATIDSNKETVVRVKRYGSAKATESAVATPPASAEQSDPFVGTWTGMSFMFKPYVPVELVIRKEGSSYSITYSGKGLKSGTVSASVEGGQLKRVDGEFADSYERVGDTLVGHHRWPLLMFHGRETATDTRVYHGK
jgi:hypothetical protein